MYYIIKDIKTDKVFIVSEKTVIRGEIMILGFTGNRKTAEEIIKKDEQKYEFTEGESGASIIK